MATRKKTAAKKPAAKKPAAKKRAAKKPAVKKPVAKKAAAKKRPAKKRPAKKRPAKKAAAAKKPAAAKKTAAARKGPAVSGKRDVERFRKLLLQERNRLQRHAKNATSGDIHVDPDDFPDEIDSASSEVALAFQGRIRERERGQLAEIAAALEKIEDGIYGECENCGEQIGRARLLANLVAELCIDCKTEQERRERS